MSNPYDFHPSPQGSLLRPEICQGGTWPVALVLVVPRTRPRCVKMAAAKNKACLIVIDGWGVSENTEGS